jgi:hypothetical protein
MKLEDQVVSLKLAREMKEMGAEQDSIWYWTWSEWNEETKWVIKSQNITAITNREVFSAYTMAELCERLPAAYNSHELIIDRELNGSWNVRYISELGDDPWTDSKKAADALAKMWILRKTTKKR